MKIYKISQEENNGWDTYDSAIVAADDILSAMKTHPNQNDIWCDIKNTWVSKDGREAYSSGSSWATKLINVKAELIGTSASTTPGIILASFNAG